MHLSGCANPRPCHNNSEPFGGLHFVAFGDFAQHLPPSGPALFYGASSPNYYAVGNKHLFHGIKVPKMTDNTFNDNVIGRGIWLGFKTCVYLKEQHRFGNDADGLALYNLICKMTHNKNADGSPLDNDDIAAMADLINDCTVSDADMPAFLKSAPRCVVLRHSIRPLITRILAFFDAASKNERVVSWRSQDTEQVKIINK